MTEGQRVVFNGAVDYCPHTKIAKGEMGTVVELEDDGPAGEGVMVKLDLTHKGLKQFNNSVYLVGKDLFRLSTPSLAELTRDFFVREGRELLKVAAIVATIIFMPAPWNYHEAAQAIERVVTTIEADVGINSGGG